MSVTAVDFDLRALVRQHLDASADPNPHAVAAGILAAIPEEHLRGALAETLPPLVREIARRQRHQDLEGAEHDDALEGAPSPVLAGGPVRGRRAAVDRYIGLLACRVSIGDEWKFLGDCTKDDLLAVAAAREKAAAENETWAKRFRTLADLVRDGQRVADLSLDIVQGAFR